MLDIFRHSDNPSAGPNTVMVPSVPWVLVSALGQRDGDGAALLGLAVCRGLMEELRLFRTALGAAELASVWAAVAPRKPERKAGQEGRRRQRDVEVVIPRDFWG